MLLLPFYIEVMLGSQAADWVQLGAFADAFIWLIVAPLALAVATQRWAQRSSTGQRWSAVLALLPVPATAAVLFAVMAAVVPQLGAAPDAVRQVLPVYVAFAVLAPAVAWCVAQLFKLPAPAARAVAFSGSTRNSLVVLPLALAVPGAMPVLPAVIVAQTLVELLSELVYIQLMPKLR